MAETPSKTLYSCDRLVQSALLLGIDVSQSCPLEYLLEFIFVDGLAPSEVPLESASSPPSQDRVCRALLGLALQPRKMRMCVCIYIIYYTYICIYTPNSTLILPCI